MKALLHHLLQLPAWESIVLLSLLPMLEGSTLLGLLVPGETALVIAGVLAYAGKVSLPIMCVAGALAAAIGDSIGYWIGREWGDRLMHTRLAQKVAKKRWDRARRYLRGKGFAAVLAARFAPGLRSVVPMLAGTARMPYVRFVAADTIGAVGWAVFSILLGWVAGAAWERAHWIAIALGIVVIVGMVLAARSKRFR